MWASCITHVKYSCFRRLTDLSEECSFDREWIAFCAGRKRFADSTYIELDTYETVKWYNLNNSELESAGPAGCSNVRFFRSSWLFEIYLYNDVKIFICNFVNVLITICSIIHSSRLAFGPETAGPPRTCTALTPSVTERISHNDFVRRVILNISMIGISVGTSCT
jgi:hypothetical protein